MSRNVPLRWGPVDGNQETEIDHNDAFHKENARRALQVASERYRLATALKDARAKGLPDDWTVSFDKPNGPKPQRWWHSPPPNSIKFNSLPAAVRHVYPPMEAEEVDTDELAEAMLEGEANEMAAAGGGGVEVDEQEVEAVEVVAPVAAAPELPPFAIAPAANDNLETKRASISGQKRQATSKPPPQKKARTTPLTPQEAKEESEATKKKREEITARIATLIERRTEVDATIDGWIKRLTSLEQSGADDAQKAAAQAEAEAEVEKEAQKEAKRALARQRKQRSHQKKKLATATPWTTITTMKTLISANLGDLYVLWGEYDYGIEGRKALRNLTPEELSAVRFEYGERKVFWDLVEALVDRKDIQVNLAIHRIYNAYGRSTPIKKILEGLKKDRESVVSRAEAKTTGDADEDEGEEEENHDNDDRMQIIQVFRDMHKRELEEQKKNPTVPEPAAKPMATPTKQMAIPPPSPLIPKPKSFPLGEATLLVDPKNLFIMWEEYENGFENQKPAKLFSQDEIRPIKYNYYLRRGFWDTVEKTARKGAHVNTVLDQTQVNTAIDRIYRTYGRNTPVGTILSRLKKDRTKKDFEIRNVGDIDESDAKRLKMIANFRAAQRRGFRPYVAGKKSDETIAPVGTGVTTKPPPLLTIPTAPLPTTPTIPSTPIPPKGPIEIQMAARAAATAGTPSPLAPTSPLPTTPTTPSTPIPPKGPIEIQMAARAAATAGTSNDLVIPEKYKDLPATLMPGPNNMFILWEEFISGVGGRKPAQYFSAQERGKVKNIFCNRKVFWDLMSRMTKRGVHANTIIDRLYRTYGTKTAVTAMILKLRVAVKTPGYEVRNVGDIDEEDPKRMGMIQKFREAQQGGPGTPNYNGYWKLDNRPTTLTKTPKTLYVLWDEYANGVDGRKPARLFTPQERNPVKHRYCRRKVFWDAMDEMVRRGIKPDDAIARFYTTYGPTLSVGAIINQLRAERSAKIPHRVLVGPED